MKSSKLVFIFLGAAGATSLFACGSGGTAAPATTSSCAAGNSACTLNSGPVAIPTSSSASIPVFIGDPATTGSDVSYNEPLVSVTICTPNHTSPSQCQTISNILLDTGSYGLRVFASAIPAQVQLAQQTITVQGETMNLAECAQFGTGADWGAVQNGDVLLGSQTAANIPIHVIDANFSAIPSGCAALCPDTDPCTAGYNGILGVGIFAQDCGTLCSNSSNDNVNPGLYFGCDASGCYDATGCATQSDGTCVFQVPLAKQIVNPVAHFASGFNNGVALTLPAVGATGASQVTGSLQLGIGTPSAASGVYPADSQGMIDGNGATFATIFPAAQGTVYGGASNSSQTLAFIDSGSNGIFFPGNYTQCSDGSGFYCTGAVPQSLNTTMQGYNATPSNPVSFSMADAGTLFNSGNSAFSNLCGSSDSEFDWGLPFFFGRTVYVGLSGTNATINSTPATGPYWAF